MVNIFKVFETDLKRISTNVVAVVIILGLCILPSLYAWFNIFSNWDPYGPDSTGNIKVAVLSEDAGASIAGYELNIGDKVIDGLGANNTIGWVFTDNLEDTIEGVESGEYYAALVMPESFSNDMISFVSGELEHPSIIYYENAKKNAIAPKITQKAQKAVKEEVNSAFISTLAEAALKLGNAFSSAGDASGSTLAGSMTEKLGDLSDEMQTYVSLLNTFKNIMASTQTMITTAEFMLPTIDAMMDSSDAALGSMKGIANTASTSVSSVTNVISSSFEILNTGLTNVTSAIDTAIKVGGIASEETILGIQTASATVPQLKQLFNDTVAPFENIVDDETKNQINTVRNQFDVIQSDIDRLGQAVAIQNTNLIKLQNDINAELKVCSDTLSALEATYNNSVMPQLNNTVNVTVAAINNTITIIENLNADTGDLSDILEKYDTTLVDGNTNLEISLALATELSDKLTTLTDNLNSVQENERYTELLDMIDENPALLKEFAASPVELNTERLYPIDNYGSAMAPFYTILALWVGALILVAIIHVHVHPIEGVDNLKPYQKYFGRYIIFFLIGQIQTLITVLGNLKFIEIQCAHPVMFWFAAAMCSFVFTLFIYSLTVAFGNIGEALAVIVMVIQVAGAGCTFPIETLPKVFQSIYDFLPFQFGMNAMKEALAGLYEMDYWGYIRKLGVYLLVSLFIGLICAIPFRSINHLIEKSKEKSGIMI